MALRTSRTRESVSLAASESDPLEGGRDFPVSCVRRLSGTNSVDSTTAAFSGSQVGFHWDWSNSRASLATLPSEKPEVLPVARSSDDRSVELEALLTILIRGMAEDRNSGSCPTAAANSR